MSFARDLFDARAAGIRAAQEQAPRSSCPHDPNADDPRTRNLWVAWMRGYSTVIPTPVDYSA